MSDWIPVCDFPLGDDLSELASFIQQHHLPARITEETRRQQLWSLDPNLIEPLSILMQRWRAGEIQLDQVTLRLEQAGKAQDQQHAAENPAQTSGSSDSAIEAEAVARGASDRAKTAPSPLPEWPWRQTPLSLLLIALCFMGWFLWRQGWAEWLVIFPDRRADFALQNSSLAWHLTHGQYWRLWTPAIVHFSFLHALFNSLGIWILGRSIEARAGTLMFALFVLLTGVASNLVQYYWSPQTLFGGMSGVVYGLIGAVFILQRWQPSWRDVPSGIVWVAVVWLLVCASGVLEYLFSFGIANAAHLGGFVSGILLALAYCLCGGARRFFGDPQAAARADTDLV